MNRDSKENTRNFGKALPNGKGLGWATNIYFIGIGGIGMSALARYFVANGKHVSGYDKVPTDITRALEELGVTVHFEDDVKHVDSRFLNKDETLVVYTPAIPKSHTELHYFIDNDFRVLKRSAIFFLCI